MSSIERNYYNDQNLPAEFSKSSKNNLKTADKSHTASRQTTASAQKEAETAKKVFSAPKKPAPKAPQSDLNTAATPPLPRKVPKGPAPKPPKRYDMQDAPTPPLSRRNSLDTAATPPLSRKISPLEHFEQKSRLEGRWCENAEDVEEVLSHKEYAVMENADNSKNYYVAVTKDTLIRYIDFKKIDFIRFASTLPEHKVAEELRASIPYIVTSQDLRTISKGENSFERLKLAYSIAEIKKGIENDTLSSEDKLTVLAAILKRPAEDPSLLKKEALRLLRDYVHTDKDATRDNALAGFLTALRN